MRSQTIAQGFAAVLFSLALAACGGGGTSVGIGPSSGGSSSSSSSSGSTSSSGSSSGATVRASVTLIVSPAQLPSAANTVAAGSTVTAIVKDSNNNLVPNAAVTFIASSGAIGPVNGGVTDANGIATAVLTSAGDPANQTITVTADVGAASASIQVPETGTNISITGVSTVSSGGIASYTVKLLDSAGHGLANQTVALASSLSNGLSPASATTDPNGQAVFTYTGTTGGADTLTATATETINGAAKSLGASSTATISVSATKLVFQAPQSAANVSFNTATPVKVQYTQNGVGKSGVTVFFAATRGALSASSQVTDSNGIAAVTIGSDGSDGAGGASISAQVSGGPSASESIQFVSTTPTTVSIQASPTTIAPAGSSALTAVVRDAQNNLVFGQTVDFKLSDVTGGSVSPSFGVTDQTGTVTATYQATSKTSAKDGVQIASSISGTGITTTSPALITVAGVALKFSLGTSNLIQDHKPTPPATTPTEYDLPWTVIVTDSAGNPAPSNTAVNVSIVSTAYQKGIYLKPASGTLWKQGPSVTDLNNPSNDSNDFGCKSEDTDNSGIYTAAKDWNHNKKLDPGAVASVPLSLTLDATGSAQFNVTYPKNFANWVEVTLTVTASVAGTESTTSQTFGLPVAVNDINQYPVDPPGGQTSPFGTASSCSDPS